MDVGFPCFRPSLIVITLNFWLFTLTLSVRFLPNNKLIGFISRGNENHSPPRVCIYFWRDQRPLAFRKSEQTINQNNPVYYSLKFASMKAGTCFLAIPPWFLFNRHDIVFTNLLGINFCKILLSQFRSDIDSLSNSTPNNSGNFPVHLLLHHTVVNLSQGGD